MKLASLLQPALIVKNKSESPEELLESLFTAAGRAFQGKKNILSSFREAVAKREKEGGTVLPSGLAIPHARVYGFKDFLIVIGIPEKAIPSPDGNSEIRMMVLFLGSPATSHVYLNALAAFTEISMDEKFFKELCALSPVQFIQTIKERGIEVTQVITAGSLMTITPVTLKPTDTLRKAIELFNEFRVGYIPVIDEENVLVGELTVLDLLSLGIPSYAYDMPNIKIMNEFDPFKQMLENGDGVKISEVMKKCVYSLERDAAIIELVVTLTDKKRRYLPVVHEGKFCGVVSVYDILEKVLTA
jgi:mannitol/fructose-specific phosphotransferase system IIA component (Ntr-type)/CBS domain-containing protein